MFDTPARETKTSAPGSSSGTEMALAGRPGDAAVAAQPVIVPRRGQEARGAGDDLPRDASRPGSTPGGLALAAGVVAEPGGGEVGRGPELVDHVAFDPRPRPVRLLEG